MDIGFIQSFYCKFWGALYGGESILSWFRILQDAVEREVQNRAGAHKLFFLGCYNRAIYMVACEGRPRLDVKVPGKWKKYESRSELLPPASSLFA